METAPVIMNKDVTRNFVKKSNQLMNQTLEELFQERDNLDNQEGSRKTEYDELVRIREQMRE